MEIEHCPFPDDLLYDLDNNTWARIDSRGLVRVGVTTILSAIAGKFTKARLGMPGTTVQRSNSLGTIESSKFVGPIPSPFTGTILATNSMVVSNPKLLNDSPYAEGWIALLRPIDLSAEKANLNDIAHAREVLVGIVAQFRARCFKVYPDYEMVEIGAECSAVLVKLRELVSSIPKGEVVHIVSDDPTAYVEMVRWTDQTGNKLVDWRTEGSLSHFLVRKTA